jgi:predicted nucleotide-binding protein
MLLHQMKKSKFYYPVRFPASVLQRVETAFEGVVPIVERDKLRRRWEATIGREGWRYDTAEEFYADYRRDPDEVFISHSLGGDDYEFHFQIVKGASAQLHVQAPTRADIESVFTVLDEAEPSAKIAMPKSRDITVFVGHGRSQLWRDLKDHLHEQHGYKVEAYEIGARAGHEIRDVLEEMLERTSFAFLVLTAEDETADGSLRARQNVVHELGLFQGRLGFPRAIVLLEEGTEEFTNMAGMQQIRFSRGNIREAFGDVLATMIGGVLGLGPARHITQMVTQLGAQSALDDRLS